jgi:hypothetical protein
MANPVVKVLWTVAELMSRFLPISKNEATVLEELRRPCRPGS